MGEGKVRGNPVIPDAPVPSQVRMSILPEPPEPVAKTDVPNLSTDGEVDEVGLVSAEAVAEEAHKEVMLDTEPKGTIFIKIYENMPYEVDFTGVIAGSEVDMAWRAMMKQYRVWKHTLFNKAKESEGA